MPTESRDWGDFCKSAVRQWRTKIATSGTACLNLAECHLYGMGTPCDYRESRRWLAEASRLGGLDAIDQSRHRRTDAALRERGY